MPRSHMPDYVYIFGFEGPDEARYNDRTGQDIENSDSVVIEAKDENKEKFLNEAADLMYHYLLLVNAKSYQLDDVLKVLRSRDISK